MATSSELPISYVLNFEEYQLCAKRRQAENDLPTSLPEGFPAQLYSPLVWEGNDFPDLSTWTYTLCSEEIDEITSALKHFQSLQLPLGCITPATFPLPTLRPILCDLSRTIHSRRGFFVLCGLPVSQYAQEETVIVYAGISSYIGSLRGRQDSKHNGHPADVVLSHVVDLNNVAGRPAIGSPAFTADPQGFHTDTGDIVGLLMVGTGAGGGKSCIASTWKIYNELAASRPDLIHTLASDWAIDGWVYIHTSQRTSAKYIQIQAILNTLLPAPSPLPPPCYRYYPRARSTPVLTSQFYRLRCI